MSAFAGAAGAAVAAGAPAPWPGQRGLGLSPEELLGLASKSQNEDDLETSACSRGF